MKVIMVMVSSINGKITRGVESNIHSWTSKEDSELFFSLTEKHNLIVMGSQTYQAARDNIKLKKNKLRVILTKNPEKYFKDVVPGSLEFTNESPNQLINRLQGCGYKKMLLVGGGIINALFLKSSLIDELNLTIEPVVFGRGKLIVSEERLEIPLRLLSIRKLNKQGTLHLRYKVK